MLRTQFLVNSNFYSGYVGMFLRRNARSGKTLLAKNVWFAIVRSTGKNQKNLIEETSIIVCFKDGRNTYRMLRNYTVGRDNIEII